MPVKVLVTPGIVAYRTQACRLVESIDTDCLIADKGCDCDAVIEAAGKNGMTAVNPLRSNRKSLREYDKHLHRARHLVENTFINKNVGAA